MPCTRSGTHSTLTSTPHAQRAWTMPDECSCCQIAHTWVHSSVARAADCRSAGPWLKSVCALQSKDSVCKVVWSRMSHIVQIHCTSMRILDAVRIAMPIYDTMQFKIRHTSHLGGIPSAGLSDILHAQRGPRIPLQCGIGRGRQSARIARPSRKQFPEPTALHAASIVVLGFWPTGATIAMPCDVPLGYSLACAVLLARLGAVPWH